MELLLMKAFKVTKEVAKLSYKKRDLKLLINS